MTADEKAEILGEIADVIDSEVASKGLRSAGGRLVYSVGKALRQRASELATVQETEGTSPEKGDSSGEDSQETESGGSAPRRTGRRIAHAGAS